VLHCNNFRVKGLRRLRQFESSRSLGSKATTSHSRSGQGPDASFRLAFRSLTSYAALRIRLPVIMCCRLASSTAAVRSPGTCHVQLELEL
jgi:hypothetical protein